MFLKLGLQSFGVEVKKAGRWDSPPPPLTTAHQSNSTVNRYMGSRWEFMLAA